MVSEQLRLRGVEAWHERVAGENAGDSVQRAHRILSGRGDVTADLAKDYGAILRTKAARYFLFQFHHADISLRLVVIEWHLKIIHKSQCLPFAKLQVIQ